MRTVTAKGQSKDQQCTLVIGKGSHTESKTQFLFEVIYQISTDLMNHISFQKLTWLPLNFELRISQMREPYCHGYLATAAVLMWLPLTDEG